MKVVFVQLRKVNLFRMQPNLNGKEDEQSEQAVRNAVGDGVSANVAQRAIDNHQAKHEERDGHRGLNDHGERRSPLAYVSWPNLPNMFWQWNLAVLCGSSRLIVPLCWKAFKVRLIENYAQNAPAKFGMVV